MALFIIGSYAAKPHIPVYGAEWDGSSNPVWIRTDDAVGFADPNPYYSEMSGTPSSPFDDIMPWSGMRIVEDDNAGTLVEIPKFWYKWTRNGDAMKLQISMTQEDGFLCSPAHADRGDGVGERDYIYVGRYHCANGTYKSTTGVNPQGSQTRATFRSSIHNLGSNIWQNDYATRITLWLLYIVEFANWNSQAKIGGGCSTSGSIMTMGYTDSMPYHTGTTASSIGATVYGGTQYRYIEGLWDNVFDWCDGVVFNSSNVYVTRTPSNFGDTTSNHTYVGTRPASGGEISAWNVYNNATEPWAIYPSSVTVDSTYSTYVCDYCDYRSSGVVLNVGGNYTQRQSGGLFWLSGFYNASSSDVNFGSRLMVLPPSRLTA